MTLYWRTSTFVASATRRAGASIFVLNPITTAFDAAASVRSDSVMSPTASWMIERATSCCGTFAIAPLIASSEPCTSALRTILSSLASPSLTCANISARVAGRFAAPPPAPPRAFSATPALSELCTSTRSASAATRSSLLAAPASSVRVTLVPERLHCRRPVPAGAAYEHPRHVVHLAAALAHRRDILVDGRIEERDLQRG